MAASEFELIARYFGRQPLDKARFPVGVGDDCAALVVPEGQQLMISVDTLVETVHFPSDFPAAFLGRRALAACVSDLAACGAQPLAFTLALTLPRVDDVWLAAFSHSLLEAAEEYGIALIGGDTTRGPLTLSLQVMGPAPAGQALLRSGARVGDSIYVSGAPGEARAALDCLDVSRPNPAQQHLLARYRAPSPRLALGMSLRGIATAAVDVSDGLAADLGHILKASGVAATLQVEEIPLSPPLLAEAGDNALDYALAGGDDYELCFTAPPSRHPEIVAMASRLSLPLTRIGRVETGSGLRCVDCHGDPHPVAAGYQHF